MSATAILAIVVAVGEAQNPASVALLDAARESLGTATAIHLVETDELSDARAIGFERDFGARAVAVLTWKEPAHLHAVIRLHSARGNLWTTRFFAFGSRDTLLERGRTLGFAVASMMPEIHGGPTPPVPTAPAAALASQPPPAPPSAPPLLPPAVGPPPPPPTPRVTERPPPASMSPPSDTGPSPETPPARPSAVAPAATPAITLVAPPADVEVNAARPRPRPFGIGIDAVGSLGVGGPASGLGGKVAIVWFPTLRCAIRGDLGLRVGPLPELPGSARLGSVGLGLEWWPVTDRKQRWALGLRADALVTAHQVTGTISNGQSETHDRLLPGADLLIRALVGLTDSWEAIGGAGLEDVAGTTDIRRGADRVVIATIPALRVVAEIGLRKRF